MHKRSFPRRVDGFFLLLGLSCWMAGCGSDTPNQPVNLQPTLSSIQSNIFNFKCAMRGCHVTGGLAPMSLETANSFVTLVNATSAYGNPKLMRVKPNDALNSSLYLKVIGDPATGGPSARMPLSLSSLTAVEVNAIRDWINAGALFDGTVAPVNTVQITPPMNGTVQVGGTLDLDARAFDANNNIVPATFSWSSSTTGIATVNPTNGVVSGVSVGPVTITASAGGKSDTLAVTVSPAPALQATLSSIQANIFTPKCVNAGCHPGGGAPMSLQNGASFAALVGVNSAYARLRVAPGNAANSVLYLKVIGDNTVGRLMPLVGGPLSKTETDSIAAWINRGALNN